MIFLSGIVYNAKMKGKSLPLITFEHKRFVISDFYLLLFLIQIGSMSLDLCRLFLL